MALPLYERALEPDGGSLVRLTEYGLAVLDDVAAKPYTSPSLIPSRPPSAGEQYRFHFDMTRCIGCRSCEIACNEQNGNPAHIQWRRVGEIEGGTYPNTLRHFLSMGCNHCLNAECLKGCPVNAYTKDAATGIVLHSTEACIGCQYCVWNCPYGVPQFNPERGVVGKCDMCKNRLEDGLEPACVNACPEAAIQIEIVDVADWHANFSSAESPGMPTAAHTISTTRITVTETGVPLERVDAGKIHAEHAHPSLVLMTTMLQAVTGTLVFLGIHGAPTALTLATLLTITAVALATCSMHLGRPVYAWRALRMWRRSWLSREVLLFTLFFAALGATTVAAALTGLHLQVLPLCRITAAVGLLATVASACIYLVPARPSWNMLHTPIDFVLTCALLGNTLAACFGPAPMYVSCATAAAWILNHAVRLYRLRGSCSFEQRTSYSLLTSNQLLPYSLVALLLVALGLIAFATGHALLAILFTWAATLFARYLFFVSVVPLKMALTFVGGGAA